MKNTTCFILLFGVVTPCFGMNKKSSGLAQESYKFEQQSHQKAQEMTNEARQIDRNLSKWTFGLSDLFFGPSVPDSSVSERQQTIITDDSESYSLSNESRKEYLEAEMNDLIKRGEKLDEIIEAKDDLYASSKKFLWKAKKSENSLFSSFLNTMTNQKARSFYGLLGSGFCCYIGIKSISLHENKLFSYSTTLIGATGASAMIYDLFLK